jgi:hypothetical protein
MKSIRHLVGVLVFIGACASASMAGGTALRTFVAVEGSDGNPCSLGSPCRSIAQALTQIAPGGEVVALDSGEYSPFVVTQSATITAPPGVYASITVATNGTGVGTSASDAIDVGPGSSALVTIKGLAIVGPGATVSTGNGVFIENGMAVYVEDCEIRGFVSDIVEELVGGKIFVKNTTLKDAGNGIALISISNPSTPPVISMDHLTINNNSSAGILLSSTISGAGLVDAAIRDSTISGNLKGVSATSSGGAAQAVKIDIERCLIADGGSGIQVSGASSTVSISNCLIDNNSNAGFTTSTPILSRGNNTLSGNGPNVGSLTALPAQ